MGRSGGLVGSPSDFYSADLGSILSLHFFTFQRLVDIEKEVSTHEYQFYGANQDHPEDTTLA